MKKIELKNCPNCKERIGIHDVECPYCKYIDDPKYKNHNKKLKKKKTNSKNNMYKILLLIPIIFYLVYLLFNVELKIIIISLILLNILCLLVKKKVIFGITIIESIFLVYNFFKNIIDIKYNNVLINVVILILGLFFIISPKIIYILKTKRKNKRKTNKSYFSCNINIE